MLAEREGAILTQSKLSPPLRISDGVEYLMQRRATITLTYTGGGNEGTTVRDGVSSGADRRQ